MLYAALPYQIALLAAISFCGWLVGALERNADFDDDFAFWAIEVARLLYWAAAFAFAVLKSVVMAL